MRTHVTNFSSEEQALLTRIEVIAARLAEGAGGRGAAVVVTAEPEGCVRVAIAMAPYDPTLVRYAGSAPAALRELHDAALALLCVALEARVFDP